MKLTIPDVPPSLNKVLRMHWAAKRKLKKHWTEIFYAELFSKPADFSRKKRTVKITLHHSRFYDKDNAYGAVKPLVDVLTDHSVIVDDSAEWLELTVEQAKVPHKQRFTTIEIEPAGK